MQRFVRGIGSSESRRPCRSRGLSIAVAIRSGACSLHPTGSSRQSMTPRRRESSIACGRRASTSWAIAPSTTWRPIGRPPPSHAVRWRVSRIMAFQVLSSGSAHHASSPSRTMRGTVARVTRPQSAGAGIGSTHRSRRCSSHQASAEEPLGTPSTRRRGRRRWSAWSQSSCGRNAGRSGSPLGRSCKEFKAKPRGCCQGSRMDFDLKVKRGIPVWLSLFSSGVSMLAGTGRFAQASSQKS